jgi:hypothetical protein
MMMTSEPIYEDKRYVITASAFSTPTKLYPLAGAMVRVRHDFVWLAIGGALIAGAALWLYADLLRPIEVAALIGTSVVLVLVATTMGILAIDVPGHRHTIVFDSARKVRLLYRSLRRAKLAEIQPLHGAMQHVDEGSPHYGN